MAFDPSNFSFMVITDTCSVWNVLSADAIFRAANLARINFYVTPMVLYECLNKPRKTTTPESDELIRRLRALSRLLKYSPPSLPG